jgi:hypothetical protein
MSANFKCFPQIYISKFLRVHVLKKLNTSPKKCKIILILFFSVMTPCSLVGDYQHSASTNYAIACPKFSEICAIWKGKRDGTLLNRPVLGDGVCRHGNERET